MDRFTFVRFGTMNHRQLQEVWIGNQNPSDWMSYHYAPVRRGFYAFHLKFQEHSMISGIEDTQKTMKRHFDKLNNEVALAVQKGDEELANELTNIYKNNLIKWKKSIRHTFIKRTGYIWHHFKDISRKWIVDETEYWVKTDVKKYVEIAELTYKKRKIENANNEHILQRIFSSSALPKDDFEVFIDEKIH